ncbi:MAG: dehydrogenase [Ruminiclostridium sp.]|nr:dehydrogenase [Ruminiclostridium sp.]
MKAAIIGGGFSGLCCAHEMERYGIQPVIFERKSFIGEPVNHVTSIISISHRPVYDALKYYKKQLNIDIKPLGLIRRLIHHSPHMTSEIKGIHGYLLKNTADADSTKIQLLSQLKSTEIRLSVLGDCKKLSNEYDYVVVATGNYAEAQELGAWQEWFKGMVRGAVVQGDFDPEALIMWINKDYLKDGYAYLAPFSRSKASLILVVSDVNEREVDHYWELFLDAENIRYTIIEEFKLEHRAGYVYPLRIGNTFFIGNSAGGLDPFLGFGHFNAAVTGVAAARSIAAGLDYNRQLKQIIKRNLEMRQFRKVFDNMPNKDYDRIITAICLPGIKQLLYHSPVNISKIGAFLSKFILQKDKLGR